jgi:uncharacterized membrane protein
VGNKRIWELDFLRAVAIVLMVIFHFVYDLNEFVGLDINYMSGFWYWEGKISALLFMFVAGISSGLSKNTVRRGFKVFGFGMVITLATFIFLREEYVRFGILHFLGFCMIIFPLLYWMKNWMLILVAGLLAFAYIPVQDAIVNTSLLIPIGIMYKGFVSMDYYPLIPYLPVFIIGVLVYKLYYTNKRSLFNFTIENKYISTLSKNSLMIYLLHQPIILAIIFTMKYVS